MPASRDLANLGDTFSGVSNVNIDSNTLFVDAVNNRTSVGTSAPKTRFQVTGSALSPAPTLGSANGGVTYISNSDTDYGLLIGTEGGGSTWLQAMRTDGTATAYNINLQPAGGNVGIGTTSPGAKLQVEGNSGITTQIIKSSASVAARINFQTTNDSNGFLNYDTGSWILFNNSAGSAVERMRIDASGRFTLPYQPAFHSYGLTNTVTSSVVVYPSTDFNVGSHYNTSNGRFTVPVTGTYLFGWTAIGGTTNDVYRWRFRVNGANVRDIHLRQDTAATGSEYATNGMFVIPWRLTAGDYVNIFYVADASTVPYASGTTTDDYPRFWGYLLG